MPAKKSTRQVKSTSAETSEDQDLQEAMRKASEKAESLPPPPTEKQKKAKRKAHKEAFDPIGSIEEEEEEEEEEVSPGSFTFAPTKWVPRFDRGVPFRSVVVGSANSGKSFLLKYFLTNYLTPHPANYDYFIIISESPDESKNYADIIKARGIPAVCSDHWPQNLWPQIKADYNKRVEEGLDPLNVCIILDDTGVTDYLNNPDLLRVYSLGRHLKTSCIYLVQSPKMINTLVRGQSDLIFLTKLITPQQREAVEKGILAGAVQLPAEVTAAQERRFNKQLMHSYMKNQGEVLVLDNRPHEMRANVSKETLFWFKAPPKTKWLSLPEDSSTAKAETKPKSFKIKK